MANGGWYGTRDEWDRLEAPLSKLDLVILRFAESFGMKVSKNHKDWPERSIEWGGPVRCFIQIYLADQEQALWNFWICCSEDRDKERFWKKTFLVERRPISALADRLPQLLGDGRNLLNEWSQHPENFEFAATVADLR